MFVSQSKISCVKKPNNNDRHANLVHSFDQKL